MILAAEPPWRPLPLLIWAVRWIGGKTRFVLQQAWKQDETGLTEWRDVPAADDDTELPPPENSHDD